MLHVYTGVTFKLEEILGVGKPCGKLIKCHPPSWSKGLEDFYTKMTLQEVDNEWLLL